MDAFRQGMQQVAADPVVSAVFNYLWYCIAATAWLLFCYAAFGPKDKGPRK